MLFSCNDNTEELIQTKNPEIEYKELTSDEVVLKSQLAEAAKIVAEISSDKEVLDEIIATIKVQPEIICGSVKFADLMNPERQLKSASNEVKKGKFAAAFKSMISNCDLKSANTLIESLISQGIEIYIPFPIEEYPQNAKIIVTSEPIDNLRENIGYEVGNKTKTVMVNYELTRKSPIIIISRSSFTSDEISNFLANQIAQDKLKSTQAVSPMTVWNDTSYAFVVVFDYLFIKQDFVNDLNIFEKARVYFTNGGVYFNSKDGVITSSTDPKVTTIGVTFPPYYEHQAKLGYVKGMFPLNQRFLLDWHPGISEISLAFYMDLNSKTIANTLTASASFSAEVQEKDKWMLKPGGSIGNTVVSTVTFGDYLYANQPLPRSMYKYYYDISDVWSNVHGNGWVQIPNGDWRPVRSFTSELFYVTHCEAIPRSSLR